VIVNTIHAYLRKIEVGAVSFHPDAGELRTSNPFFDMGMRLRYNVKFNFSNLELSGSVKNMFNSCQKDLDTGAGRDPAYIYGPALPRMIYIGIKAGDIFK